MPLHHVGVVASTQFMVKHALSSYSSNETASASISAYPAHHD
jgi:hypothetical protein